ncbi:MAG: S-layer homology domain-containing protein [Oscillospiraceae bacterium]|nr:S-layer homology domain-containing protein [Oscillospiraceae bacterium]
MKRRIFALFLSLILALGPLSAPAGAAEGGFSPVRTYEDQFSDVSASSWFYDTVKALYELGLTNGSGSPDRFDPSGDLTVAEVITMASRLRSLYETGDSEAGGNAYGGDGGEWYLPYVLHLQALDVIGQELEGSYDRPATRAEMAHVLAGALPRETLDPINREAVASGYGRGRYIRDVREDTPYQDDILLLYDWGVAGGSDDTGSFRPDSRIARSEAAAMVARLADPGLRVGLDWEILPLYSKKGYTLDEMVESDGTFYVSPDIGNRAEVDADVRYMLANGERTLSLEYPEETVNRQFVDQVMNTFLSAVRDYVEQTYNSVTALYYPNSKYVELTFTSSLYDESQIDRYREETMDYAIRVHDQMWAEGRITGEMTEYEKARVYFDWICNHCRYDYRDVSMSHSGYQAFTTGLAVCDGYVAAYNLLLRLEGIRCGTCSTSKHIWTVAELDGETYHIDPTWGDQPSGIDDRYFAMTEEFALGRF